MKKIICLLLGFAIASAVPLGANNPKDPVPYSPDEFPSWARALRRGEIVALGVFPFVFLFSSLAYDTGRFVASGGNPAYAPGPFQAPGASSLSQRERVGIVMVSVSISSILAVIDYWIESRNGRTGNGKTSGNHPPPDR